MVNQGKFGRMIVIGLILLTIMQIFFVSSTFNLGIIVFGALIAYDMQEIKRMQAQSNDMHGVVLVALSL